MSNPTPAVTSAAAFCLCGCYQETGPKAFYRPGHDAAHVSNLLSELVNRVADHGNFSQTDVRELMRALPSIALQVKFQNAADKLGDKLASKKAPKPPKATAEWFEDDTTDYKVGRWTYPTRYQEDKDGYRANIQRNTKRDGSGEWVPAKGGEFIGR